MERNNPGALICNIRWRNHINIREKCFPCLQQIRSKKTERREMI